MTETTRSIAAVAAELGSDLIVGAGTVLTTEQAEAAVKAGAKFLLSAVVDKAVICRAKELGAVMIPGAMTPTEILDAYRWGADIVKVFPAGTMGPDYLKAVRGPLPHIPLMAVGVGGNLM